MHTTNPMKLPPIVTVLVIAGLVVAVWLARVLARPPGVPAQAVRVPIGRAQGWARCWLDAAANVNRCRLYNAGGELLRRFGHENDDDDVFLPYEGLGPIPEADLQIDRPHTNNPSTVWLKNGVILLPRNDFETAKRWVDVLKGKRENFFDR